MKLELIRSIPETGTPGPSPLLFVHGAFAGAWCWEEYFLSYFSDNGYAAYALSFRGHGNSEGHAGLHANSLSDYLDDLASVVGRFDAPPVLVGHSMGGLVVQNYLASRENLPAVLMASVPKSGLLPSSLNMLFQYPVRFQKLSLTNLFHQGMWGMFFSLSPGEIRDIFFNDAAPVEDLYRYASKFQPESIRALMEMNCPGFESGPRELSAPVLVMGAENDTIISAESVCATAKEYGTEPYILSGMGHTMMLEKNWRAAADFILQWLAAKGL